MLRIFIVSALLTLVTASPLNAEQLTVSGLLESIRTAHRDGKPTYRLDIDNDSLLLQDQDGLYSSGARLHVSYWVRTHDRLLVNNWHIGQELYTPSDIKLVPARVGPPQRPYAGWLYGSFVHHVHHDNGSNRSVGVDVGCLGPCAGGEWTQKQLHRLIDEPQPRGWSRQVRNEPGIVVHGNIGLPRWQAQSWIDLAFNFHGRIGNIFTDAGAEMTARAGELQRFPDEPTLHGFVRIDGRVVAYDATLQGGLFSNRDRHTVAPKRHMLEGEAGFSWNLPPFAARISVMRRSNEVRDLPSFIGSQNFARLQLSYTPH